MTDKQIIDEERMFECVWCKYSFKESDANFILSENPNECICSSCITEWADNLLCDLKRKEQECERLKWYLKEIRYDELKALDIEWDEYETHCIDSEYSNIINLVEEALKERSSEDCRYDR